MSYEIQNTSHIQLPDNIKIICILGYYNKL